jgi:hypothetical protein
MLKSSFQEHGKESPGSIKGREFADHLDAYQLLKKRILLQKITFLFFVCEAIGTAATPGLLKIT